MTTIAYRDGVMAADTRAYGGNRHPVGCKSKAVRFADGTLAGCSSNSPGQPEAVLQWAREGADAKATPSLGEAKFRLLLVRPNGEVFLGENSFHLAGPLSGPFFSVGSGEEYAMGAMWAGCSADVAVQAGIELDPWSGGRVTVLRHGD